MGKASAVIRALQYSVVMKRELSKKAKLSVFNAVFVRILTYGHESWVMTERIQSQLQASEMKFLLKLKELRYLTKCSSKIRKSLKSFTCESKREKAGGTTTNTLARLH